MVGSLNLSNKVTTGSGSKYTSLNDRCRVERVGVTDPSLISDAADEGELISFDQTRLGLIW